MKNWMIPLVIVSLTALVLVSGLIAQEEVVSGLIAQEEGNQNQAGRQEDIDLTKPVCGNGICEEDEELILCKDPPRDCDEECMNSDDFGCHPLCPSDCENDDNTVCGNGICEDGEADDCPSCNPQDEALGRCSKRPCIQGTCPKDCPSQGIGQTIRNRVKAGIYTNEEGEEIRVSEMAQDRTKLKNKETEVETELEIESEEKNYKTKLKTKLSNGRNAEIKIMPNTASEKALERLKLKVCSEENECKIELKEVGKGDDSELVYEFQAKKQGRFLGIFKMKMKVQSQINAENGDIISTTKPWWAFLVAEE